MWVKIFLQIFWLAFVFTIVLFCIEKYAFRNPALEYQHIDTNYEVPVSNTQKLQEEKTNTSNLENENTVSHPLAKKIEKIQQNAWDTPELDAAVEEKNIPEIWENTDKSIWSQENIWKQEKIEEKRNMTLNNVKFSYTPKIFVKSLLFQTRVMKYYLLQNFFEKKIDHLNIDIYAEKSDRRGNMKDKVIRLWSAKSIPASELISVFVHEFGHYYDIYVFEFSLYGDKSDGFYDISWKDTYIILPWQSVNDFVSGYAATNKYEDFAETMAYFVLHNQDFYKKAQKNPILQKKYDFFDTQIFEKNDFLQRRFSLDREPKNYYWDITKIPYNEKKFLQYLENTI